jgi:hypothetical protein
MTARERCVLKDGNDKAAGASFGYERRIVVTVFSDVAQAIKDAVPSLVGQWDVVYRYVTQIIAFLVYFELFLKNPC